MSEKVKFKFELGVEARDNITGFQGKITGRADYLTGCRQYNVEGFASAGPIGMWVDEDRLELTPAPKVEVPVRTAGGPMPHPQGKR